MTFFRKKNTLDSTTPTSPQASGWSISSTRFALLLTIVFILFYNSAFFNALVQVIDLHSVKGVLFGASIAVLASVVIFIVMVILTLPFIAQGLIIVLLIGAASAAYFMNAYGIVIHQMMIQNIVETDAKEATELFNLSLLMYLLLLGVVPAVIVSRLSINYGSFLQEVWKKIKAIGIALIVALALIGCFSADYASFFRNNKNVRQLVNPVNFIYAGISYLGNSNKSIIVKPIGEDAKLNAFGKTLTKPTLLVIVVGETARADHFSINGYTRPTTPLIAQQNIINYPDVYSCGTETAVSVPCMFSSLGRENYSDKKAKSQEGLLDLVKRSGYSVLWRDNNSGCKGTCDRVEYEDMSDLKIPEICNEHECFDNILLHDIDNKISSMSGNKVIVLHQKGSHGPDYYKRVPDNMTPFKPICQVNKLQDCSKEELINAFDNTIAYTDQFLNKSIEWLKTQSATYDTALIYLSDHGESLGEKNLYLHGMPYVIAPEAQKHIPFFFWFSEGFQQDIKINRSCLEKASSKKYSQDNLFHTTLGLLNIDTSLYNPELDMVRDCRETL